MNRIIDAERVKAPARAADGELLSQFLNRRDDGAFAELVGRHGSMVYGVCLRRLGQCHDAEDAFQAVFFSLAKHAWKLCDRANVGPWLYTLARRMASNAARSRRRRRWVFWASSPEPPAADPAEVDVDLDAALATLNEPERSAIVLCHLEGLSRAEAAKALGCPEGTLSTRLARGLEKLRRKLGKPPLAALVAASLVILPNELPAATVDLVHHFRDDALDDWMSPGAQELYRKADPMRYLHRAGPVVAAFAAVALIMVGASFGWNFMPAQEFAPKKKDIADTRAGGRLPGLGGGDSNGLDAVKKEVADDPADGRLPGLGGGALNGRGSLGGPGFGPADNSDSGRIGVVEALRGMEGGSAGMVSSQIALVDAVKQFNDMAKKQTIGKTQPPLTEDEVVAAIRGWRGTEGPAADALYRAFQQIADTKKLPRGWNLTSAETWRFNNYDFDVWRIELEIATAPNTQARIVIRDQKLRVRPASRLAKSLVGTTDSTMIVIPLKNASADSIAEVLTKAISGKWVETKVTSDPRTNSLIILAPKAKETSIRQTVQALDELQK